MCVISRMHRERETVRQRQKWKRVRRERERDLQGNGQPGAACAPRGNASAGRETQRGPEGLREGQNQGWSFRSGDPPFVKPPTSEPKR